MFGLYWAGFGAARVELKREGEGGLCGQAAMYLRYLGTLYCWISCCRSPCSVAGREGTFGTSMVHSSPALSRPIWSSLRPVCEVAL